MKKTRTTDSRKPSAGSRIIASLQEAVDWVEGKDVPVRVTTVEVPTFDVRATRKRLGLSQAAFAAKFGFQPATLRNWEQGRTRPDGPARVLLAVIARHPEAVEDALRKVRGKVQLLPLFVVPRLVGRAGFHCRENADKPRVVFPFRQQFL